MRKVFISIILVIIFLAFLTDGAWSAEFCVSTAIELQNALTVAETNGEDDIIKVVQGIYNGNFTYNSSEGNSITLLGGYRAGCASRVVNPSNTILDGGGSDRVIVLFNLNNGGDIFIEGFFICNGASTGRAGGVDAYSTSSSGIAGNVTITNNIIEGNEAWDEAGGAHARSSSSSGTAGNVTITNNIIKGNHCDFWGGGLAAFSSSSSGIAGNIIITNNIITGNSAHFDPGGGVYASSSGTAGNITITNNTIAHNTATFAGGGISLFTSGNTINVYNNIIWGNTAPTGGDISLYGSGIYNGYNNDYSDMAGTWTNSGNNINSNPHFFDTVNDDYHLQSISPCIDAGTNTAPGLPNYDFDGDSRIIYGKYDGNVAVDMGADEYLQLPIFCGHDFDGNNTSDVSVWRPLNGRWYIKGVGSYTWGTTGDIPVNGDYNGDGVTDIAVWRPSNGRWYIKGLGGAYWGQAGDIPVPGDYNGDGITDIAVWRPSNGRWYLKGLGGTFWGIAGDIPVPGDYNGDGITDIAVWRPSNGRWYIKGLGGHFWGMAGDIPLVR